MMLVVRNGKKMVVSSKRCLKGVPQEVETAVGTMKQGLIV